MPGPPRLVGAGGAEGKEELLAIHFGAAQRWPEAWRYGRIAGERALERAAPREAAGFLRSALEASRWVRDLERHDVAVVATKLGDAAELFGSLRRGRDAPTHAPEALRRRPARPVRGAAEGGPPARGVLDAGPGDALLHARPRRRWAGRRPDAARSVRARIMLAQGAARLRGKPRPRMPAAAGERRARGRGLQRPRHARPRLLPARLGAHRPRQPRGRPLPRASRCRSSRSSATSCARAGCSSTSA